VKFLYAPEVSHALVGTPRCDVTARVAAGGTGEPTARFTRNVARLSGADGVARRPYPSRAVSERGSATRSSFATSNASGLFLNVQFYDRAAAHRAALRITP
jgi:hypothetical protein